MCWHGHDRYYGSERADRWDRPPERRDVRVSDADRQVVIEALQRHTGDGRLTLEEFEERVDEVLGARTRADLDATLRELPALHTAPQPRSHRGHLPLRPIAACILLVLLFTGSWWVLIPLAFVVCGARGGHAHRRHHAAHRFDVRDDSVAPAA
jgi:hypothetical protein